MADQPVSVPTTSPSATTTNAPVAVVEPVLPPPSTTTVQLSHDPIPGTVIYMVAEKSDSLLRD